MNRMAIIAVLLFILAGMSQAEDLTNKDPGQLFFSANNYYQKQDYTKALEEYRRVLDIGFESGRLYYNMGNCFFKLGKPGYAILYYEKALRLMPQDGDLRSNLAYARSLAGLSEASQGSGNPVTNALTAPFRELSLRTTAVLCLVFYVIMVVIAGLFILNPLLAKKFTVLLPAIVILAVLGFSAFGVRYYNEEMRRHGIAVKNQAECKYEPIDKSTTYYKLQEGDKVDIIKTRSGWSHIRRSDGKIAWVESGAVEEI